MLAPLPSSRERTAALRAALRSGDRSLVGALAQTGVVAFAAPDRHAKRIRTRTLADALAMPPPKPAARDSSLVAIVVVGLLALAARSAYAAPESVPDKARQLADKGRTSHEAGDYNTAIAAYTEAYAIAPSPALLFNLAQAYRLRGSCDDAVLMYRRYLDTSPSPEARAIAEGHLATVERCAHKIALSIPLDDQERAAVPVVAKQQDMARGSNGVWQQRLGVGLALGGGLALAAATYFTVDALSAQADVEHGYQMGGNGHDLAPIDARGQRSATLATWLGVGGGVLVAGGVTTYLLGRRAERAMPIAIAPKKGGAEVSLAWRF
jgi:tetratricopeptide (TPR) repeat protein